MFMLVNRSVTVFSTSITRFFLFSFLIDHQQISWLSLSIIPSPQPLLQPWSKSNVGESVYFYFLTLYLFIWANHATEIHPDSVYGPAQYSQPVQDSADSSIAFIPFIPLLTRSDPHRYHRVRAVLCYHPLVCSCSMITSMIWYDYICVDGRVESCLRWLALECDHRASRHWGSLCM